LLNSVVSSWFLEASIIFISKISLLLLYSLTIEDIVFNSSFVKSFLKKDDIVLVIANSFEVISSALALSNHSTSVCISFIVSFSLETDPLSAAYSELIQTIKQRINKRIFLINFRFYK
jgi:hypothetical protein